MCCVCPPTCTYAGKETVCTCVCACACMCARACVRVRVCECACMHKFVHGMYACTYTLCGGMFSLIYI